MVKSSPKSFTVKYFTFVNFRGDKIGAIIAAINISYLLAQKSATDTTGLLYAPISCLHHKIHIHFKGPKRNCNVLVIVHS